MTKLYNMIKRYRTALQLIERDLGAEYLARRIAHEALGEPAVESAPWERVQTRPAQKEAK